MKRLLPIFLLLSSAAHAQTAIPILNPSFETNAVMTAPDTGGGPWSLGVPQWTTASPSGLWQPTPNVFASLPDSKTIAWVNSFVSQDLGVPAQPNTTYTLTVFVGHLSVYEGSYNFSLLAGATSLCNLAGSNKTIPLNTFGQITMPCVIGATAPTGNLVLKLASADGSHQLFDNVLLLATSMSPPQPVNLSLSGTLLWDDGTPIQGRVQVQEQRAPDPIWYVLKDLIPDGSGNVADTVSISTNFADNLQFLFIILDATGKPVGVLEEPAAGGMFRNIRSVSGFTIVVNRASCAGTQCLLGPGSVIGNLGP